MLPIKQNLAANEGGYAYRITVTATTPLVIGAPRIEWEPGRVQGDATEMLLDIEARIGELIASVPEKEKKAASGSGRRSLPDDVDWHRSNQAQAIHRNPGAVAARRSRTAGIASAFRGARWIAFSVLAER